MDTEQFVENLKTEVKAFADKIIEISKTDKKVKDLYKGVQIYFSPLVQNPLFMFLGINPGSGYFDYNHECVYRFEPLKEIEYKDGGYMLAEEWRYVFGGKKYMLNRMDLLESAFKTNVYYVATEDKKSLDALLAHLRNNYNLENECFKKPCEWTKTLIEIVRPKIILCEGLGVLDELKKVYPTMNCVTEPWGNNENYKVAYIDENGTKFTAIACARVHSRIKNPEELADIIAAEAGLKTVE